MGLTSPGYKMRGVSGRGVLRQGKAQKRGHTLRMASECNEALTQKNRPEGTKRSAAASYPQPRFFSLRGTFKFWRTFP